MVVEHSTRFVDTSMSSTIFIVSGIEKRDDY